MVKYKKNEYKCTNKRTNKRIKFKRDNLCFKKNENMDERTNKKRTVTSNDWVKIK